MRVNCLRVREQVASRALRTRSQFTDFRVKPKKNKKMDEQIKQLAENLKKSGLAASMYEAIEKAKSILNVKTQKTGSYQENTNSAQQNPETMTNTNLSVDVKNENVQIKELMKEVGVEPEHIEEQKQQKLDKVQEKSEQIKEEVNKVQETKSESTQSGQGREDIFKEEEKIDLTKVFNNNK